jgi:transcriptional enhancer factor
LLDIPKLGRKKFNISGKPHGRNELISLYLWLAHLESLAPGEKPDESKRRGRKQVSSHIQVLKNFMRGEPYCKYINVLHMVLC